MHEFDGQTQTMIARCDLTKLDAHKNYRTDLHENFTTDVSVDKEELVKFWKYPLPDPDPGIF